MSNTKSGELRKVPFKNYLILGIVIVFTILVLHYFRLWVDAYKESELNIPIIDKYMEVINYNELDNYVVENPNTMVYVSVLENQEIRDFEKKLKNKYKKKGIQNDLLYMNITNELMDSTVKGAMGDKYSLNNLDVTDVPCVLLFEDGLLKSIYSVSSHGYDIDKFVEYVNGVNLESDDF